MSVLSTSLGSARLPAAAIEVSPHQVSGARLEHRSGRPLVAAHAVEPLPAEALVPSLTESNLRDHESVATAVRRVLERLGRPRRVGLLLPDSAAKVSIVRFEQVPVRSQDLDELVRWQVRKAVPFPIDTAQVGYVRGWKGPEGQEFIVTVARRETVVEYEELCSAAGAHAGVVDLAAFNVVNAVQLAGAGDVDWLLVNVSVDSAAIVVMRGSDPIFFRNRTADSDGNVASLVHETAMYYEDRLQGTGFSRVLLAGASAAARDAGDAEPIRRTLEGRLGAPVEIVDVRKGAADLASDILVDPVVLDTLAPLVGLLLRGAVGEPA